jgi:hypothetical protein
VDVVDAHDKHGLCKRATVFQTRQRCLLLCQACIFASAWMNQRRDYDLPNKTWLDCCNAACKHLDPSGNEAAKSGETLQGWLLKRRISKSLLLSDSLSSEQATLAAGDATTWCCSWKTVLTEAACPDFNFVFLFDHSSGH